MNNIYDREVTPFIKLWQDAAERPGRRGNSLKMYPQRPTLKVRENYFAVRVVKIWNKLPETIVKASSVNSFKNKLDKYMSKEDIVFDNFKALVTGSDSDQIDIWSEVEVEPNEEEPFGRLCWENMLSNAK